MSMAIDEFVDHVQSNATGYNYGYGEGESSCYGYGLGAGYGWGNGSSYGLSCCSGGN